MGAVRTGLGEAWRVTVRNPSLAGISLLATVLSVVALLVAESLPLLGLVPVIPIVGVFHAGVVGAVHAAARDGADISAGDYVTSVRQRWRSVFGAYLGVVLGLLGLVSVLWFFLPELGTGYILLGSAWRAGDLSYLNLTALFGLFLVVLLLLALVVGALVVQFLDTAVVAGEETATGAYTDAATLLAEAPGSVLGYSLLRAGILLVGTVPVAIAATLNVSVPGLGIGLAVPVALVTVTLALALQWAFHTHYYLARRPDRAGPPE
jgi:hypothetical protein